MGNECCTMIAHEMPEMNMADYIGEGEGEDDGDNGNKDMTCPTGFEFGHRANCCAEYLESQEDPDKGPAPSGIFIGRKNNETEDIE